ncbi:class I SAM-dependent methyltransferase [Paenibacillus sp. GSMTC-2017]|uniref:class I SAM-dependent methyltransferase n=1 Tax=Paenibacillus sp. GSMTC-2017 TaxID=2794350 RepID=UPI0018D8143A|nr:class I SAM-dependent methyltransferase [Paenibacillus sp. GSMTC-2017]MBH5319514.1 class I SAM-dependent methyltransferase [Paenibacillus sp. GSMTC-2017]
MDKHSRILLDEQLLSCVAYYFCEGAGLSKRYGIAEPNPEAVQLLQQEGILSSSSNEIVQPEFGYACYEYYRQTISPDEFDTLLLRNAEGKQRILDLCCGPGATVHALLRSDAERIVYAVDHNPFYLSLLCSTLSSRNLFDGQVQIQANDAHHIELEDQSLDFIICRTALQYLHIPNTLAEMYRLLEHGGSVFLVVHGLGYLPDYFVTRKQLFKKTGSSKSRRGLRALDMVTFSSLKKQLKKAGFHSIEYTESSQWLFAGILPIYFAVTAKR